MCHETINKKLGKNVTTVGAIIRKWKKNGLQSPSVWNSLSEISIDKTKKNLELGGGTLIDKYTGDIFLIVSVALFQVFQYRLLII